jgi:hypothetical protein
VLAVCGAGLVIAMTFTLRSSRARDRLCRFDAHLHRLAGSNPPETDVFVRRFETGIYGVMCLGTALVLLGVVVAAT